MIFDSLENLETYRDVDPRIWRGLQLLRQDWSGVADGRYEVDEDLYYMIQSYETKERNDLPEAHRRYVDIQMTLAGSEIIGVGPLPLMEEAEAHPERDLWLYRGPVDRLTMDPGRFVILWPQDAHAAGVAVEKPAPCHKIVVKVRIG